MFLVLRFLLKLILYNYVYTERKLNHLKQVQCLLLLVLEFRFDYIFFLFKKIIVDLI